MSHEPGQLTEEVEEVAEKLAKLAQKGWPGSRSIHGNLISDLRKRGSDGERQENEN